jgi:CheY-like chemotaxis protein
MQRGSVLVIEDNELNMKLVRSLLQLDDFDVLEADNAEKGIRLMHANRPDLVLMDIQLPGMDGLAATRALKADPELKNIPVIALTGYAMEGDEEAALEAGCLDYITKPIDTRQFLAKISNYFDDLKSRPIES